jgi:hypothetical protein
MKYKLIMQHPFLIRRHKILSPVRSIRSILKLYSVRLKKKLSFETYSLFLLLSNDLDFGQIMTILMLAKWR